ncbi:MAG: DUF402 domain-containing protein [Thermoleophilia bacterium]|nr:DUF402 domain-containing protein [Thermoleophilia bacterium]
MEAVEVFRGHVREDRLFGPLPGVRDGGAVAYEFELPDRFEPWPGRTRLERVFVLIDVGVSFSIPCWVRDGTVTRDPAERESWYVDLVTVEPGRGRYAFRDLYVDLIVPTDGRHHRLLDLDEYAGAILDGTLTAVQAADGLCRWQQFLDRHLHTGRWPSGSWADFPPAVIRALSELPAPLAPPVRLRD